MEINNRFGLVRYIFWVVVIALAATIAAPRSNADLTSLEGYFSVRDFGAKADGKTDDTSAFQKAANQAAGSGGYVLVPPIGPGKGYVITRTVRLPRGVSLIGSPAGFGNNVWAAFDLPEKSIYGAKLFARPAPSEYQSQKKKPLFVLEGGNTVRGLWIMYDQQPWPTDQEFNDTKSPYHYDSFNKTRANFINDHVKPYGPTFYLPGGANTVIEDIACDRYYDFFFQVAGGRNAINRVHLYGYKRGFVIKESADVNRLSNIHLCPGTGPACPGKVGVNKKYSWIYSIVASQPDCVGIQLGKSDGYCISNSLFLGVHTGVRLGASASFPIFDPVTNVQCFYDPLTSKQSGFVGPYSAAAGPWGYISTLCVDGCVIGLHFVWPSTMTTCMLTNAYIATTFTDGQNFPANVKSEDDKPVAKQGAFVVEPTYCTANNIGIIPTFMCSNAQISSFNVTDRYGPSSLSAGNCNGRAFLINGDITADFSNLQINAPYNVDRLYATGPQANRYTVRMRGVIETGEPVPDITINRGGLIRP